MIITDDETPSSPDKGSVTTPLLGNASTSATAPPAYTPRQNGPAPIGTAQAPYPNHVFVERRQSAGHRFCRAFLVAFGIWILASALLGSILDNGAIHAHWDYPTVPGVSADHCVTSWPSEEKNNGMFASFPYSVNVSFDIPLPTETLLLLSQGSLSNGNLQVTTSPNIKDSAHVQVVVNYHRKAIRDQAKICLVQREKGEEGVGIFTPRWQSDHADSRTERLLFDVVLTLPRSSSGLYINRLHTDVNNFEQDLESLKDIIKFGHLDLKGTNGRIHAKTLSAEQATLTTTNAVISADYLVSWTTTAHTTNALITGSFKSQESVNLKTTNGPIRAQVEIEAGSSTGTKKVSLQTTNDPIDVGIVLTTQSGSGGDLSVTASTTSGHLTASIQSLPIDAALAFTGTTTNSGAMLKLPSTFDGDFDVRTTNAAATVHRVNPHERDPASKDRVRTIQSSPNSRKTRATGSVFWGPKNTRRGKAVLRTTNGAADIYL
ncbi:hypothetical protein FB45DRAFT_894691 [Roridomyces roridus]|uniref:Uncharacterized protein n=1 Tax=Roridomyces roridus TaxID=1738132 RepID=A0AAD7CGB1_9AGAR|nr:hypothetical protein FB45DRAFT_894691 [Roridomyces roridus]